jgi:hypothetical protein
MTYRQNKKARKLWSEQANANREAKRIANAEPRPLVDPDPYLKIVIERRATCERAEFECFEGDRIDNYRVYCNGKFIGVKSITELTSNIRKALPRYCRIY